MNKQQIEDAIRQEELNLSLRATFDTRKLTSLRTQLKIWDKLKLFFEADVDDTFIENYMYHTHLPKWNMTLIELIEAGRGSEYLDYLVSKIKSYLNH